MINGCQNCKHRVVEEIRNMDIDAEMSYCDLGKIIMANGCCDNWESIETIKENPKVAIHKDICKSLNSIYEKKNSDYGDSFSKLRIEYGNTAILIRLEDKLGRLKRLMQGSKQQVMNESIDDSLKDLANYAIMELVERRIESESK